MNKTIGIDTDTGKACFVLTGDVSEILKNNRLIFSFKRLKFKQEEDKIVIPFNEKRQIEMLQEIQELLEKFNFNHNLSTNIKKDVENFGREQESFQLFSEKARSIRNDEFKTNPELVDEFDKFQNVLQTKLVRKLYSLQLLSAFHMAFSQNACNFSVPGAGKTAIVYGTYAYLKNLPSDDVRHIDKLLVIGPLSSFAPWENEFEECFGTKANSQRLSGDNSISRNKKEQHLYSGSPAEISLIFHGGIESLQNEIKDFLKNNKTMIVVDEAHRIKNPEGVWGKSVVEIAKDARSRIILTGTPAPNGYEDIFNLYQFIYPFKYKEILKTHYEQLKDMTKNSHFESSRVKKFTDNIAPYFIRIKKKDLKLPEPIDTIVEIEMDKHQREIYDFIETKYIKSFQKNNTATVKDVLNRAKLIRLRQASTSPSLLAQTLKESLANNPEIGEVDPNIIFTKYDEFIDDSEFFSKICNYSKIEIPRKFIEIKNLLSDKIIKHREKVIIWTIFIKNAKELKKYLEKNSIKSELLIGEIEQSQRELTIKKFNNPDNFDFQVIIANPFSVSESISLHKGCHNAIYLERDYNCSNFLQSKDRIHRYGLQDNQETNYYYFLSKNSIDETINTKLNEKVKRMEKIIDEDIPLFARLNDDDETDLIKALMEDYAKRT